MAGWLHTILKILERNNYRLVLTDLLKPSWHVIDGISKHRVLLHVACSLYYDLKLGLWLQFVQRFKLLNDVLLIELSEREFHDLAMTR